MNRLPWQLDGISTKPPETRDKLAQNKRRSGSRADPGVPELPLPHPDKILVPPLHQKVKPKTQQTREENTDKACQHSQAANKNVVE